MGAIGREVHGFLAEHVHSTAELDLLLLMRRDPAREWTPEAAGAELRMPVPWAAGQLATLRAMGVLAAAPGADAYHYAAAPELARVVDAVADAYRTHKTRVVSLIYSEPAGDAESFADAFRIRRREP